MNATKLFVAITLCLALVSIAVMAGSPVQLSRMYVNDIRIEPNATLRLDVEKGGSIAVRVGVLSFEDARNVEIKALISGFDGNKIVKIQDTTDLFDMEKGVEYVRHLVLNLPDDVEIDDYKLRIIISDRNGEEATYNFNLKIDGARHFLKVKDVVVQPNPPKAGAAVLARVRVENQGQLVEKNVKVEITLPTLSLSAVDFINKIPVDDAEETSEMLIKLPKCLDAGAYPMLVKVWYNQNRNQLEESSELRVTENEACKEATPKIVVQQPPVAQQPPAQEQTKSSSSVWTIRKSLEVLLLVLVALLIVIGLVIGFSRLRNAEE